MISRADAIAALSSEPFDVVVVGGGITGAGVALDAASRGYSVALVEKDDYASGTSSRSSKLIHGGLRYLQQFDLGLVREALLERQLMVALAPHLVRPLKMVVPAFEGARLDRVVAVGLNYHEHAAEGGRETPPQPVLFAKFTTSIIGHGARITWDPGLTAAVDFEAELAVVIGRTARRVTEAEAPTYVLGYTCLNDVSARDLQFSDKQFVRAKSLDTFTPIGPALVTHRRDPRSPGAGHPLLGQRRGDAGLIDRPDGPRRGGADRLLLAGLHAGAGRHHRHRHALGRGLVPRSEADAPGWRRGRGRDRRRRAAGQPLSRGAALTSAPATVAGLPAIRSRM